MEEKELKTSLKQRIFISLIAVIMLGTIIASYAAILVAGNSSSTATSGIDTAKVEQYTAAYEAAGEELAEASKGDFAEFIKYKSKIVAYNEAAANGIDVKTEDVKAGTGREITDGDTDYLAYYVGWCADETIFDSSFDSESNPTAFVKILDPSLGMIEGWTLGIVGMKLDGIRIITIPGSLAYGETMEICGGTNKPLKFMVMTKERTEELEEIYYKLEDAYLRLQYASYGIDYDDLLTE